MSSRLTVFVAPLIHLAVTGPDLAFELVDESVQILDTGALPQISDPEEIVAPGGFESMMVKHS